MIKLSIILLVLIMNVGCAHNTPAPVDARGTNPRVVERPLTSAIILPNQDEPVLINGNK